MVICPSCKSIEIKIADQNFARKKPEGQPAVKTELSKQQFYCWTCAHAWNSNPESEKLYAEYVNLKGKTTLVVHDMHSGKKMEPQYLDVDKMMRKTAIAKELVASHKHTLDVDPGEWYDLEQEAQL